MTPSVPPICVLPVICVCAAVKVSAGVCIPNVVAAILPKPVLTLNDKQGAGGTRVPNDTEPNVCVTAPGTVIAVQVIAPAPTAPVVRVVDVILPVPNPGVTVSPPSIVTCPVTFVSGASIATAEPAAKLIIPVTGVIADKVMIPGAEKRFRSAVAVSDTVPADI